MTDGASFGRVLKARRRGLDLTQDELAKQVGYSVITIRKIEADERRPSRPLAERLALALDIAGDDRAEFIALARREPGWPIRPRPGPAVPAPREPARSVSNLPAPLTRLVGRDEETATVARILGDDAARLVTLVGPPGIGKSRLGLHVAGTLRRDFPDGAFFVPLATVGDPLLVVPTIAKALDVREQVGRPLIDRLVDFLRERRVLLLLDDFEHMLPAAPDVARVLTACPALKVLATSRSPLHLRGERLYQVPPLGLPMAGPGLDAATALRSPAVALFVERARDSDPGFALSDADAPDVAAVCAHLDGLPLAIELVAARVRLLTPAELAARIEHRLALLTGGPADLPARQQTLRRTIDWSYDLLDPAEQTLFARTAVFNGGFGADAAEAVIDAHGDLPLSVADGLDALVTKNLLGREGRHLVLLETIREYALERLAALGEETEVRDRHASYYLRLAEAAAPHLTSREQQRWLDRLESARDNLRGALEWYAQRGATDSGLRLVAALWKFWHIRSRPTEGHRAMTLVLGSGRSSDDTARAQALHGAGWIALDGGDQDGARAWFDESLAIFRRLGHVAGVAEVLHGVGVCAQARGEQDAAAALFAESLTLYRDLGADEGVAWSLDHLGDAMLNTGHYERAEALLAESLAIFRALRQTWGAAIALHHQGLTALARHDVPLAEARLRDSLELFADLDNGWGVTTSHDHLGYAALARGDHARAREHFVTALRRNHAEQDRDGFARSLAGLASLAVRERRPELAGRLFGAADALSAGGGIRLDPVVQPIYARDAAAVRAALGEAGAGRAHRTGGGLDPAELLASVTSVTSVTADGGAVGSAPPSRG